MITVETMFRGLFLNNNELRLNKTNKKLRFNSFKLVVEQFGCGYAAPSLLAVKDSLCSPLCRGVVLP
jgi:hypothetical protein